MDMFVDFIQVTAISGLFIAASCMAFYELMYVTWKNVDKFKFSHRHKIFIILFCIFMAHIITVFMYGILYYVLMQLDMGYLAHTSTSAKVVDFTDYVYFSVVSYSSLGMDDVLPFGRIKFISGAEVLNGMVLIAWSASFTYISMEKFWHIRKGS